MTRWTMALGALIILAGCNNGRGGNGNTSGGSGSSTGGTSGTTDPAQKTFCDSAYADLCALYQSCDGLDPAFDCNNMEALFGDTPAGWECPATGCDVAHVLARFSGCYSAHKAYDESQASQCLAAIQSAMGAQDCSFLLGPAPSACEQALQPGVALGSGCDNVDQCIGSQDGGAFCVFPGTCNGTCTAPAALGESCATLPCAEGYCDIFDGQICKPLLADGADCSHARINANPCIPPDNCVNGANGETCQAPFPNGASCYVGSQCQGGGCAFLSDAGLSAQGICGDVKTVGQPCSGNAVSSIQSDCQAGLVCFNGTCSPPVVDLGQPCDGQGGYIACAHGYCDASSGSPGTCRPFLARGQPCAHSSGCDPFSFCSYSSDGTAVCMGPTTEGQPCNGCVFGDACVSGTCQPQGALGDACTIGSCIGAGNSTSCDATGHCAETSGSCGS